MTVDIQKRAADYVASIVARMVDDGYPVEATNKAGHAPDHLPVEHFAWRERSYNETVARVLVGGWWDKGALIHLVKLILDGQASGPQQFGEK